MAMMAMMMFICVVIALIHGSISTIKDDCNDMEGGGRGQCTSQGIPLFINNGSVGW